MATQTDLTANDLRELVNKAAKKDRRIVSFSILFSVIAVAAGVLWLWYAYDRVQTLDQEYAARLVAQDNQLKQKSQELDQKTAAVAAKQKELTQVQNEVKQLQSDLQTMKQFSAQVISTKLTGGNEENVLARSFELNPKAANLLPRVYLRFHSEEQRKKAEALTTDLQKQGFLVPETKPVNERGAAYTTIHFYRESERDEATQIAEFLRRYGVKATVEYVRGSEDSKRIRPRHYEVLFGSDF